MPNALGNYDEIFFAQESLEWLHKSLGMAGRVHRGYEPSPQQKGSTIRISRPMTFTADDMPVANTDLEPDEIEVQLNFWKGVTFSLNDKELSHTKDRIINDHVMPAATAVADAIDASLCGLYTDIPWVVAADSSPSDVTDFTDTWQRLFDNNVPMRDLHLMLNGERTAKYMALPAFSQWQGAGQSGVNTQMTGSLGEKFGFEIFSNQNVKTHTTTAITGITALQLNADAAKGATQIVIKDSDGTLAGTIAKGDTLVIAGDTQRYAATANATAGSNLITLNITPPLVKDYDEDDAITLAQSTGKKENLAFQRGAFALAMAPLSDKGNGLGARIASISDPVTNLSIRSRLWYEGATAKVFVSVDALWGIKTFNPNLAARLQS